jgi:hypothetical protein
MGRPLFVISPCAVELIATASFLCVGDGCLDCSPGYCDQTPVGGGDAPIIRTGDPSLGPSDGVIGGGLFGGGPDCTGRDEKAKPSIRSVDGVVAPGDRLPLDALVGVEDSFRR